MANMAVPIASQEYEKLTKSKSHVTKSIWPQSHHRPKSIVQRSLFHTQLLFDLVSKAPSDSSNSEVGIY